MEVITIFNAYKSKIVHNAAELFGHTNLLSHYKI